MSEKLKASRENVVPLKRWNERKAPVDLARLPTPIRALRDKAQPYLQTALRALFDKADDALFESADKASNNQDQSLYFDSMREVRLRRGEIESRFFLRIDRAFAGLLDPQAYGPQAYGEDGTGRKPEPSLDELSLVQNDELEELVATESMINKANDSFAESIQHLTLRMDHLVPVKVYQRNNPLGADVICTAFGEAIKPVPVDVQSKLVLFKLFDRVVLTDMDNLYRQLNQILIDANILPSLSLAGRVTDAPRRPGSRGAGPNASSPDIQDLHHTLQELFGDITEERASSAGQQEAIASDELVQLLSRAQKQSPRKGSSEPQGGDLRGLLKGLLDRNRSIDPIDEDVINLVSMMFEFILDDRNLAAPMKALLGRLQIPMVKVAIADKSFFSKQGHPARRLLNEMADAALGWQEPKGDGGAADTLYPKMESVIQTLLSEFESDTHIFEQQLNEFRAFLEKDKRRAQVLEQRTLDAEDGKARSEQARAHVNRALERMTDSVEVPSGAERLLREAWSQVMFITCLKNGYRSEQWQDVCRTGEQLVWSVTAPMTKANRQQLLKVVPRLLPKLRAGLEAIAFNPYDTTQLFKELETLHLGRLRAPQLDVSEAMASTARPSTTQPEVAKTESAPNAEAGQPGRSGGRDGQIGGSEKEASRARHSQETAGSATQVPQAAEGEPIKAEVETVKRSEGSETSSAKERLTAQDPHWSLVANITQGTWFEMKDKNGQDFRCRLAAIIKPTGKYIFVNRSGMKVAEQTREGLALALKEGRMRVLDDTMLFERALESVIGNLRHSRSR